MKTVLLEETDSLDHALRTFRTNTRFILGPGTHHISPHTEWAEYDYTMLGSGCELIGQSPESTSVVWVCPTAINHSPQYEILTAGSRSDQCARVRIENLAVLALCPPQSSGIVGIHVWSESCVIRNVMIEGIGGVRQQPGQPSSEGFGLLVNQPGDVVNPVGGSIVENVEVVLSGSNVGGELYVCGLYVGYKNPSRISRVRDVTVRNPSVRPAHASFGLNGMVLGTGWVNEGRFDRAIFCDVTGGVDSLVTDSILSAERVVMELRNETWHNISLRNSLLRIEPVQDKNNYGAVLVLAGGEHHGVTVTNCQIECVTKPGVPIYAGSMDATAGSRCGLRGCSSPPTGVTLSRPTGAFIVS